ncbi:MAG TPA: ribosomal-binding protein A [Wolbachia sp.]|jgi:ribosome-binding factor A|uniref:ribosome-binding factor A n=1 Tax=Wolbachia endosymbiont of Pentalonia nigronervosa TaxID=1301914 RepID=UPI000EBDA50D|nr:ribosome-binding factor A [Wolbachia endosymbiont of Pentalonia nigronervosa]MBD0391935.1 ribosome-binding factor A [Wolbachia endosymbiont of Pentalonia nigronervosa]HCE59833.1 ribosomal-binding protein A [Wolbachia sp.]
MKKEIRNLKIASVLHRAISRVLMESKICNQSIVVSEVKLSKDMSKADVYIVLSSLNGPLSEFSSCTSSGTQGDINSVVNEMNQSAWLVRKSILHYVKLRFIPELVFKPDLAFNNFVNVDEILRSHIN